MSDRDYDVDDDVREALAQALGEKKLRVVTKIQRVRQLIIYAVLVLVLAYVTTLSVSANRNARQLIATCYAARDNAQSFNELVDRLLASYQSSPVLTPAQRKARVQFFSGTKQRVPVCPPER